MAVPYPPVPGAGLEAGPPVQSRDILRSARKPADNHMRFLRADEIRAAVTMM